MDQLVKDAREWVNAGIAKYDPAAVKFLGIAEREAGRLAEHFDIDKNIAVLGALFMDCRLTQSIAEGRRAEHVKMSSDAAKEFFGTHPVPEEFKNKVINCVEAHHQKIPYSCLESELCANADCYKFYTAEGIFRLLAFSGARGESYQEIINLIKEKLEEKHKVLSLDICKKECEPYYEQFRKLISEANE